MTFMCYLRKAAWEFLLLKSYQELFCSNNDVWGQALKNSQELRNYKGIIIIITASQVEQASLICDLDTCLSVWTYYIHISPTSYLV